MRRAERRLWQRNVEVAAIEPVEVKVAREVCVQHKLLHAAAVGVEEQVHAQVKVVVEEIGCRSRLHAVGRVLRRVDAHFVARLVVLVARRPNLRNDVLTGVAKQDLHRLAGKVQALARQDDNALHIVRNDRVVGECVGDGGRLGFFQGPGAKHADVGEARMVAIERRVHRQVDCALGKQRVVSLVDGKAEHEAWVGQLVLLVHRVVLSARRAKLVVRLLEGGNLLRRAKDAIVVRQQQFGWVVDVDELQALRGRVKSQLHTVLREIHHNVDTKRVLVAVQEVDVFDAAILRLEMLNRSIEWHAQTERADRHARHNRQRHHSRRRVRDGRLRAAASPRAWW
eukprot:m.129435 g.129435  ORF g.129435 m.129435 type:complete len:340 (-) comp16405_c0_seq6:316-1335(-)